MPPKMKLISVISVTGRDFYPLKTFDKDLLEPFRQEFSNQLQNAKILLCDEFINDNHDYLFRDLREDQHSVLFASTKEYNIWPKYDVIHLGASLRSTCRIAKFADGWIKAADLGHFQFECKPAHNFEGENIDFTFVKNISSNSIVNKNNFVAQCVKVICEHAEKSTGLEVLPVVPLVDSETKKMILDNLKEKGYACYEPSFEINNDDSEGNIPRQDAGKNTSSDSPSIYFFNGLDIEGTEFGTVLVLLRLSGSQNPTELGNSFFTAITRASIKVVIVLDDVASFNRPNHFYLPQIVTAALQQALTMAFKKRTSKPSVIIVGTKPNIPGFRRQDSQSCEQVPAIKGISLHVGEQGSVLHIDDVYKESDLRKLLNYGIRLVILFNPSRSPWQYEFYRSSFKCIRHFKEKNRDCFDVSYFTTSDEDKLNLIRIVSFFAKQSRIPGVLKPEKNRQRRTHYDEPAPEGDIFSWDKWKAKATEHYKLGQIHHATVMFGDSIFLLQRHYKKLISQSVINLSAAIQDRIELAKLYTNVALMFVKDYEQLSNDQRGIFDRFRHEKDFGSLFERYIIPSFLHAMRAIEWNACWERGFERAKTVILKMREHYSEKESSFGQTKDATLEGIITEEESKNVDPCFAEYRKTTSFSLPAFFQAKLDKLDRMIANYEMKVQSLTFAQLIPLREQISAFGKLLAKESLRLVPEHLAGSEIKYVDVIKVFSEAKQIFDYPVLLVTNALYWNPLEKDCYGILHQALERLEKVVEYLEWNAKCLGQQRYLAQIIQNQIGKYPNLHI